MNQRYVVIVDPYSSASLLPKEFQALGFQCIAVHSKEIIPSSYASSFRPENFAAEFIFSNVEDCVSALSQFKPKALLAGAESGVQTADQLANEMGLPSNDFSLSLARRDKYEMQETIARQGIRSIKQLKTACFDDVVPWLTSHGIQEYIIKPLASAGSEGVKKCTTLDEARAAFDAILNTQDMFMQKNTYVLVQEFIHGTEYVVDTVSCEGRSFVTNLCRYGKCRANGSDVVYKEMEFLHPDEERLQSIVEYNKQVLGALGIRIGSAHSEIMLSSDGPVLIEVGARVHGGYTPKTVQSFSSASQLELSAYAYTNPDKFITATSAAPTFYKNALVYFFVSYQDRIIKEIEGKERLKQFSSYFSSVWNISENSLVHKTVDLFTSPGWVVLMNECVSKLLEEKERIGELEKSGRLY